MKIICLRQAALTFFLFFCCTVSCCIAIEPPGDFVFGPGNTVGGTDDVITGETPNWHFTVPRGASRTSGVAPLYVFFSAGLTPSSPTERSFHDYAYSWDFGDPASGNWGTDGKSRNSDYGPVAAHVFERPGTYTVTLRVRNASGLVDKATFTITVDDPDVVFAGNKTTCVSDTAHNDFSGCPAGADHITTDSLAALPSWTTSGRRVLFHRGSSWTQAGGIYPDYPAKAETVRIGAYGSCQAPDANGICANAPHITVTGSGPDSALFHIYDNPDWAISDLNFTAGKDNGGVVSGSMGLSRLLINRVRTRGFDSPIGWSHWRTSKLPNGPKEMAIVNCDIRNFHEYGVYAGAEDLALMGNQIHNSDVTHIIRVWWAYKGVVSHNIASGSSLTNTNGRQVLKLHGPSSTATQTGPAEVGDLATTGPVGLSHSTQFVVVANNVFGSSGPFPVAMGAEDYWSDERINDVVFENNRMIADYGQQGSQLWRSALLIGGSYFTIRNNIIDGSYDHENPTDFVGITFSGNSVIPLLTGNVVYNNTFYCSGNKLKNGAIGIMVEDSFRNTVIRNNLMSFPDETHSIRAIVDDSGNAIVSNNVLTTTPGFVDPNNTNPLKRNFSLTSSSTMAIGKGYPVPVFYDFYGTLRARPVDIGACAY